MGDPARAIEDPETKAAILSEDNINPHIFVRIFNDRFDKMYPMEDPIEYLPDADQSVAARAEAAGEQPASWLYDFFLENDGKNLIYIPAANYNADIPRLLQHPSRSPHSETVAPMWFNLRYQRQRLRAD